MVQWDKMVLPESGPASLQVSSHSEREFLLRPGIERSERER